MKLSVFFQAIAILCFFTSAAFAGGGGAFTCTTNNCPKSTYQEMPMTCEYDAHTDVLKCDFGGKSSRVDGAQKCLDNGGKIIAVTSARIHPHVQCWK